MACCLTAPSHNLNQCWLENLSHYPRSVSKEKHRIESQKFAFENSISQNFLTSPRGQWVKVIQRNSTYLTHLAFLALVEDPYIFRHILNKHHGNIKFKFNSKFLYCLLYMVYRSIRTIKGTTELIQLDWHTHTDTYIWQLEHEMPNYRHVDPWPLGGVQETKEKQRQKITFFKGLQVFMLHIWNWHGLEVKVGKGHHWLRPWLGAVRQQAMTWAYQD